MAKGSVLRKVELAQPEGEPVGAAPLRLDLGAGKTKMDGWVAVDYLDFGQPWKCNLGITPWCIGADERPQQADDNTPQFFQHAAGVSVKTTFKLKDACVDEVRSSHFVEHLTGAQRIEFFNELCRVMKVGATAQIVTPNWSHACAYGDPTHQWPPMSQWYPLYLNKVWRDANAPHAAYTCDFDHVVAGSWDQAIENRNPETKSFMMNHYSNAWRDLIVTLTKK